GISSSARVRLSQDQEDLVGRRFRWGSGTGFLLTAKSRKSLILMAHRAGFEPTTPRFVVWCSIQLSYRCLRLKRLRFLYFIRSLPQRPDLPSVRLLRCSPLVSRQVIG